MATMLLHLATQATVGPHLPLTYVPYSQLASLPYLLLTPWAASMALLIQNHCFSQLGPREEWGHPQRS